MLVFLRTTPFPKCQHCGERLGFWVPGLPDAKHSHPACEGAVVARNAFEELVVLNEGRLCIDSVEGVVINAGLTVTQLSPSGGAYL